MARRAAGLAVSALSAAVLIIAALSLRAEGWPVGLVLWLAAAWGALSFIILALVAHDRPAMVTSDAKGTVTTIIRLGDEPTDVARTSVVAAAAVGPTMIVATDRGTVEALGALDVPVVIAPTVGEALVAAAGQVETDAVLTLSANAFADVVTAANAAGLLRGDIGWVTGRARPFNWDGYAPTVRERLDQRIREAGRAAGTEFWEPNATLVRTALLRTGATDGNRPMGSWLRDWRRQGHRGVQVEATLSVWSVPVMARWYWHRSVLRRRGVVADMADSAVTCRGKSRWTAIAMLMRELYAVPFGVWLISPVLMSLAGVFPFRLSQWLLAAIIGGTGVLRWATLRWMHGVPARPLRDVLAAAYDAPGSLLAVPAAMSRRVRPTRFMLPLRPLAWVAVLLAVAMVVTLVDSRRAPGRDTVAAMALAELAILWLFGMQGALQLGWLRSTSRFRLALPVTVDGIPAVTIDATPTGLTVRGRLPDLTTRPSVAVDLELDDGTVLRARGAVRRVRAGDADVVAGLALTVDPADDARWVSQLARAAVVGAPASRSRSLQQLRRAERSPVRSVGRVFRHATTAVVGVIALAVGAVLVLLVFDYHPMVVRSGSMEPTLRIGDIVLVRHVPAERLKVGDVATFDLTDDGGTTHRVVAISEVDVGLVVESQGDANPSGETWSISPDAEVGLVVRSVPHVGILVAWLGSTPVRPYVVHIALGAAAVVIGWPFVRRRGRGRPAVSVGDAFADGTGAVDHHVHPGTRFG